MYVFVDFHENIPIAGTLPRPNFLADFRHVSPSCYKWHPPVVRLV